LNYGGPDRSIKLEAFKSGIIKPRRYRNRRLGDFLKELDLTEGKATGIPRIRKAMRDNGSPEPVFDFDDERTFFEVDFLIHPAFLKSDSNYSQNSEIAFSGNISGRTKQIIEQIIINPSITAFELSKFTGISKRAIEKQLAKLKTSGVLERSGSDKSGYWIIKSSV